MSRTLTIALFAFALIGCANDEPTDLGNELNDHTPELDDAFDAPSDNGFCNEFPELCDIEQVGDNDADLIDDETDEEPVVTLEIEFYHDSNYDNRIEPGYRGVHMGGLALTAVGGDVPFRGMVLTTYANHDGDELFNRYAESDTVAAEHLEDCYFINGDTGYVQIGSATPTSDGEIMLIEDVYTIEEGEELLLDLSCGITELELVPGEGFAYDLASVDDVWADVDQIEIVQGNGDIWGSLLTPDWYIYHTDDYSCSLEGDDC